MSHSYSKPGQYRVMLKVQNLKNGQTKQYSQVVVANIRPVPFMELPTECKAGELIKLDASKSKDTPGDRLTYTWDFGDGSTGTGRLASHRYLKSGNYTVTLTVKDDKNTFCSKATLSRKLAVSKDRETPSEPSQTNQALNLSDPRLHAHQARFSAWRTQSDRK